MAEARLPFWPPLGLTRPGVGTRHCCGRAVLSGATVLARHAARSMSHDGGRLRNRMRFVGAGCRRHSFYGHRQTRSARCAPGVALAPGMVGLKMYYAPRPSSVGGNAALCPSLTLFSGGYAGPSKSVEGQPGCAVCVGAIGEACAKAGRALGTPCSIR